MMSHEIQIPRALKCFDSGTVAVSSSSVGLPDAAFAVPSGRNLEILIGVGDDDIYMELKPNTDATTNSMPYASGDKVRIPGMASCKALRMIRKTTNVTVYWQAFCDPLTVSS
jgi:hypothetical protein